MDPKTHLLQVPGAHLCYDVRGSGPLLLLTGSPMGSRGFAALASLLAASYTVVTHDPRGILRSTLDDPSQDATPELLADDLYRLLRMLGDGQVCLFGNSGGAMTGLALVTRYPDLVRTFVAHEPPSTELLPDSGTVRAAIGVVCDTYAEAGRDAALKKYTALTGIRFASNRGRMGDAQPFNPPGDVRAILDRFFRHILRPTTSHVPDLAALRAASTRIVVGGGIASAGQLYHRCGAALAGRLGTPLVGFPGGHTGFQDEADAFARVLHQVISEETEVTSS